MIRRLRRLAKAVAGVRSTPATRLTFGFMAAARLAVLIGIVHAYAGQPAVPEGPIGASTCSASTGHDARP